MSAFPLLAQQKTVAQGDIQFNEKVDPTADDMEALRRFIRDKRFITMKEIGGDLSISGDVRTEFQDTNERRNDIRQRGKGAATSKPQYAWDVECNLAIDYRTDRTWIAVKLEFDNDMGQRSGTVNRIRLEKAYLGGRIVPGDTLIIDAELGRRYLFHVYESKVEFASLYDGVLFRFNKTWPSIGDFYTNVGALLVDDRKNHYAYVTEIGGLHIYNTGLNLKYSMIDWYKPYANELLNLRYKYFISQFIAQYQFAPDCLGKRIVKFYSAALTNWIAPEVLQTGGKRKNWGWYAGVTVGLVKKQFDWAIDLNYQWVQAQTVPDFDCSGIGRGNAKNVGFYTNNIDGNPKDGATTRATAVGACNYHGFEIEGLYAFTDNLTVLQNYKFSRTLDKSIGPDLKYQQYEVEFIYAF